MTVAQEVRVERLACKELWVHRETEVPVAQEVTVERLVFKEQSERKEARDLGAPRARQVLLGQPETL